jgi:hypothetical protein
LVKYVFEGDQLMLERVETLNGPITEADLRAFEARTSIKLPESYREFLLTNNGGRPVPPAFSIEGFAEDSIGAVQVFFGLGDNVPAVDLNSF